MGYSFGAFGTVSEIGAEIKSPTQAVGPFFQGLQPVHDTKIVSTVSSQWPTERGEKRTSKNPSPIVLFPPEPTPPSLPLRSNAALAKASLTKTSTYFATTSFAFLAILVFSLWKCWCRSLVRSFGGMTGSLDITSSSSLLPVVISASTYSGSSKESEFSRSWELAEPEADSPSEAEAEDASTDSGDR